MSRSAQTCVRAAVAVAAAMSVGVRAESRFPQPEFDSGYTAPVAPNPMPNAPALGMLDVAVLAAALAMAAYFVLHRRSRRGVFWLMIGSLAYFGFLRGGCVCAVGSVQNVALGVTDSAYAVATATVLFFALPLLAALLFGRVFCAAVCPLGAIQDVVALRPVALPRWLGRALGLLPYAYLGLAVLYAATGTGFIICRFDPFVAAFRFSGSLLMLTAGAALLGLGVFVARPYCRFLCPYGVLLSWASRVAWRHATITPDECVQCRLCADACPFDAIREPTPAEPGEARQRGVRRLAWLLPLVPVLVGAGAGAGWLAAPALARADRDVRLAARVWTEDRTGTSARTEESEAFRASGRTTAELYTRARDRLETFRRGSAGVGAVLGAALGVGLVRLSIRRRQQGYEPDRGACLSCARCFRACPKEQQRRRGGTAAPQETQ